MTSPFRGLRRAASTSASSITTCCALSPPAAKNTSATSVGATTLSGAVPPSPLGNTAIHPSASVSATSSNAFSYPYPRSHTPLMVLPPPLRCGSACGITSSTVGPPFSQHQSTVSSRYSSREFSISSSPKNEDIDNNNNINNETNYDFGDIENNCYNVNSDNNLNGSSGEATISLGPNNGSTAEGRAPNDTTTTSTTGYEYCIGGGEKPPQFDDECQPYSFAVRRTRPPLNRAIPPIPESKSNESIISAQSATLLRNINNSSSSNNNDNNNNSPSLPTAPSAVEQHIDDCVVIENLMAQNLASRSGTRVIGVGGDVHAVAASSSSAKVPPSSSSRLPKLLPGGRSKRNHPASPIISTTASTIPSSLSSSITAKSPLMSVRHLVKNRLFGRHHDRDADAQLRMSRSMMTMRRDDSASKIPTAAAAAAAAASKMSKSISLEAESPRRTKHDRKSKQHTATVLTLHHNQQQPPRRLHLYSSQQKPSIELVTPTTSNAVGWYTTDESAIPRRLPSTTLIPTTIGMSNIQTRLPLDDLPPSSAPPPPLPPHRTFVVAEGDGQPPHGCRKSPTIETGEFERKTPPKQVQFDVAESPTRKCSSLGAVVVLPKAVELPLQRLFIERTANAITVDAIASAAGNTIRDIDDSLMSYEPSPAHSLLQQQPQKRINLTPLRLTSGSDLCRIPGGGPFSYSSSSVPPPTLGMRKTPQSFPPMPGSAAAVAAAADVDDWRRAKQPPRSLSIGAPSMRKALRDDVTTTHEAETTRKRLKKNDSLPAGGNGRSSLLFSTRSLRLAAASMLAEMSPRLRRHHATTSTTVEEPDATPSVIADATAIGGRDNRSTSDRRRNTFRKSASIPEDSQESHLVVTTPTLESERSAAENEKHKAKKLKTHKTTRSTSALSVPDVSAASKGGFFAAKRMAELRTVKSVQNKNRRAPLAEIESSRVAENSPAVEMPPTNFDGYDGQLQQQHKQQEKQQPKRRFFLAKKIDNNKNDGDDNNNYCNKSSGLDKNNNNSVKMESTTIDGLSSATTTTTRTTTTATIYYATKTTVTTAAAPTTTIGAPQPIVAQPDLNNNGVSLTEILFANGRQPPPPPSEPPPPSTSSLFSSITTIISGDSGAVDEISTHRPARDANNNSQLANKLSADAPRSDQSNNNNVPHNDIQLIDDSSTTTSAISSPTVHIDNKTNNNNSRIVQLYHSSIPLRAFSTLNTTRNSRSSDTVAYQTAATTMVMSSEEPPLSSPTTTNSGSLQLICEYEDNGPVVEHRMEKMKIRNSTESCVKSFRQQQQKPATPTTTKTPLSATTGTTRLPTTTKTTAASRHHNKAPATTTATTKTTKAQRSNSSTNSRNGVPTAIADDAKSFDDVDLAMTSAAPFPLLPEMITDFKCQLVNLQDAISRDCEEIDRLKTENETLQAQLVHRNDVINALRAKLAEAGLMQAD